MYQLRECVNTRRRRVKRTEVVIYVKYWYKMRDFHKRNNAGGMIRAERNIFLYADTEADTQTKRIVLGCIKNERANVPQWRCVEPFVRCSLSRDDKTVKNENDECIRVAYASRCPCDHAICVTGCITTKSFPIFLLFR